MTRSPAPMAAPAHTQPAMGQPHPHESARAQVTGNASYSDDLPEVRGTLYGAPILSRIAHGHLHGVDASAALQLPGVRSVVLAADVPGDKLLAAFAQRLIWSRSSKKRMLIWEHLLGTPRVQKFIRDDKIYYIKGQATSLKGEYFPMEESLARAIRNGLPTGDAALEEAWINQDVLRIYLER